MSKAILVIDMPKDCYMCPCFEGMDGNSYCMVLEKDTMINTDAKPKDCPLKHLPKQTICYPVNQEPYWDGYNDCLDEILGEK